MRAHHLALSNIQQEHCAAQMERALKCWDAHTNTVSLGLQTEFPIIICNLATGTDAIIGTDVLGSVLPHTLDIKQWLVICTGWCFAPTSPERFGSVRPGFYSGPLLDTTIFRRCAALLRPNYRRSGTPIQWITGGIDAVRRRYRPYRGQNSGRPIQVEGSSPGVKF